MDELAEWLYLAASLRGNADPLEIRTFAESIWNMACGELARTPFSGDMATAIINWTRELGQPLWAESLERVALPAPTDAWPHHILAAHELGICEIDGLEFPHHLMGGWVSYEVGDRFDDIAWLNALRQANGVFSQYAVVSDRQLMHDCPSTATVRQRLQQAIDETNLALIVNLNWPVATSDDGPTLFSNLKTGDAGTNSADALEVASADQWHPADLNRITWRWHVRSTDSRAQGLNNTRRACEHVILGGRWQFAFTGSGQVAAGAIELVEENKPVLQSVTVDLRRLLRQEHESINSAEDALARIASLARLVLEIGQARRRMFHQAQPGSKLCQQAGLLVRIRTGRTSNQLFQRQAWDQFLVTCAENSHVETKLIPVKDEWPFIDQANSVQQVIESKLGQEQKKGVRTRVDPRHSLAAERLYHLLEILSKRRLGCELFVEPDVPQPKSGPQLIIR